jgi:hypothetical protein
MKRRLVVPHQLSGMRGPPPLADRFEELDA